MSENCFQIFQKKKKNEERGKKKQKLGKMLGINETQ